MEVPSDPSPPPSLRRLSYRSLRVSGLDDYHLLTDLIFPAERRNRLEGITGCLWVGDRTFVHVIEGEEAAIHNLMGRIVRDTRHTGLRVLSSGPARRRLFNGWSLKWVLGRQCVKVEGLASAAAAAAPPPVTWPEPWRWADYHLRHTWVRATARPERLNRTGPDPIKKAGSASSGGCRRGDRCRSHAGFMHASPARSVCPGPHFRQGALRATRSSGFDGGVRQDLPRMRGRVSEDDRSLFGIGGRARVQAPSDDPGRLRRHLRGEPQRAPPPVSAPHPHVPRLRRHLRGLRG